MTLFPPSNTIMDILSRYEETISGRSLVLRDFLLTNLENIEEQPDPAAGIIGYSYGKGYKDMICTIMPSKKGVKLGFYKGSELPDPAKLLKGTGKVHRYVDINSAQDIDAPPLKKLLGEALKAWEKRTK